MAEQPEIKCKVECRCGWTEVFSSRFSGVIIECPHCGKTHLIPVFGSEDIDESIDMETMNRLLEEQHDEPSDAVTVPFRPLFMLACAVAVVLAVVMTILYFTVLPYPVTVISVIGGGFGWPLGIAVAWLGQRRQVRARRATN